MAFLARRRPVERRASQTRALTASAHQVQIGDRNEARRLLQSRQAWQLEAWAYRRSLGELRYATSYLGNSASRMRLFPGVHVPGDEEPQELTQEVAQEQGIPADLATAAQDVIRRLGSGGPKAVQAILRKLTENFEVAGECYLVGCTDPITLIERWDIRSISELHVTRDGKIGIRESPTVGQLESQIEWLDPNNSVVFRLWWPDPEFGMMADSPVRAVLDICEELLLLGRDVRATAKSRLANNGLLMLPDSLRVITADNSGGDDPEQDPFMSELIATAAAALTDEGSAAALVPVLLRGPAESIAAVKHLHLQRPANVQNIAQRGELISRMATSIDLPSEILTGKADLNHWTAWQVSDDAFRHHIEPIVVVEVDALTAGFFWTMLDAYGQWDPALIRKLTIWYDPTALVTHPDRTTDAKDAFDRGAIGRDSLRKFVGMGDDDKPDELDEVLYILQHARGVDPTLLTAILKTVAKTISIPDAAPAAAPALPPGGDAPPAAPEQNGPADSSDVQTGPPAAPPAGGPPAPSSPDGSPSRASVASDHWRRLARAQRELPPSAIAAAVVAATGSPHPASRRLTEIDRELRAKLLVAANAAVKRTLERAGSKVVSKSRTASAAKLRDVIQGVPTWRVPAKVGPAMVAALGLTEQQILDKEFADLKKQWDRWVSQAQRAAMGAAASIVGADPDQAWDGVSDRMGSDSESGWDYFQRRLGDRASSLLSQEDSDAEDDDSSFVSSGMVRAALAVAGGFLANSSSAGIGGSDRPVDPTEVLGGIGGGYTVSSYLSDNGAQVASYTWIHGSSDRPFEPHLDLDGEEFANLDDPGLLYDDFPSYGGPLTPGDHSGCSCDFQQNWSVPSPSDEDGGDGGDEGDASVIASILTESQVAWVRDQLRDLA